MDSLKTILVPVDFSERSAAAARHAVVLAKKFDANLIFLHVIRQNAYAATGLGGGSYVAGLPAGQELEASAEQRMAALVEKASEDHPVGEHIVFGRPAEEIARQTQESEIDLVVMPTHGYGPFRRFLLGSVTAKVLHDVACPVLTGRHVPEIPAMDVAPYRRIACAVDLTEHSEVVVRWAKEFAAAYDAKLTLIHATPEVTHGTPYGDWYPANMERALLRAGRQKARELLKNCCCDGDICVASGTAHRVVKHFVQESGAELLIVGRSSEESSLGRLRTNAYAIIRESPCPVISV